MCNLEAATSTTWSSPPYRYEERSRPVRLKPVTPGGPIEPDLTRAADGVRADPGSDRADGPPVRPADVSAAPVDWTMVTPEELGVGFVAGIDGCLAEGHRRWSPLVYTLAYRLLANTAEAEDVTQQVFVGAWRGRSTFRPELGSMPAWLLGHARHRVSDRQRARAREARIVRAALAEVQPVADVPSAEAIVDRLLLQHEMDLLPDPKGRILRLAFYEGHTYAQIADGLDLPVGTVKSHARRALLQLRRRMR